MLDRSVAFPLPYPKCNGSPDTKIPWPLRTVNGSEYQSLRGAGDNFLTGWQSFRSSPLLFLAASSEIDGGKKRRKKKWADSVYGAYSLAMLAPIDFISKSLSPNTVGLIRWLDSWIIR